MAAAVRLGLAGAGRWGRNLARTIAATPGARLARLASRNPESAALVPADCLVVADWRELLAPGAVDALVVATPPRLHAEMAAAAIDAGLPVLVEKPLTMDAGQALALRERAVAAGVLVWVGHTHLFHPAWRALKARAAALGPVRAIRGEAGNFGPYRPDVPVLWDWGAHDVAMCLDLLGEAPSRAVAAVLESGVVDGGLAQAVALDLDFPGGARAAIRVGNREARKRRFAVALERGELVYDGLAPDALVAVEGGAARAVPVAPDLPLSVEVAEFAAAVAAGRRDTRSLDLGVRVVETLAACERAASAVAAGA